MNLAIVAPVPVIPDLAEEVAPIIGINRPICDDGIGIAGTGRRRSLHWQCSRIPFLRRGVLEDLWFYARNELQLPRTKLPTQEAVNVQGLFRVDAIDHG